MAKLIINPTSSSRREIQLSRTLVSIGRDPSNDLVLPDAMVSRRHAVIEYRGSQYYVRDCNSSNGSLVNGDRVSERSLRDGDLVAIGTARLLFREDVDVEDAGAKVVQHPSAPRQQCPNCNADYRKGDLFCRQCGAQLAQAQSPLKAVCTSCGTAVPLPAKFCNACGSALGGAAGPGKDESPREEIPHLDATKPRPAQQETVDTEAPPAEMPHAAEAQPNPAVPPTAPAPPEPPAEPPADPAPPIEGPRPLRSAAAAEPALASAPPVADMPRRVPAPSPMPDRPRPVPHLARSERAQREIESPRGDSRESDAGPARPAGFGPRLAAGLIDGAIVSLGSVLLLSPAALYWWPRKLEEVSFLAVLLSVLLAVLIVAVGAAYYVYFWGVRGATPGKLLLDLSVEGEDGTYPIGVGKAVARLLGYVLSGATLGIGFLMIAANGTGLHDRVAGTRVVRRPRA